MDMTQRKTDAVTGLPLYDGFLEIAKGEIDNNPGKMLVLISTDIANFKYVNKIYGYNKWIKFVLLAKYESEILLFYPRSGCTPA